MAGMLSFESYKSFRNYLDNTTETTVLPLGQSAKVFCGNCEVIYKTDDRGIMSIARCIPAHGFYLFEICATYAKTIPPCTYYRLGKTMNEAKRDFKAVMGDWMKIISARLIPPGEEAESILTNPIQVPL